MTVRHLGSAISAVLLGWSAVGNLALGERGYLRRNLGLTVLLLRVARRAGLAPEELGLAPAAARRGGLGWGTAAAATVGMAVGVGVRFRDRLPGVAELLDDERARRASESLGSQVLVRIPVGTALFEEVAFRGVLLAALSRERGDVAGLLGSSAVFGLWHVPPTIVALRENGIDARSAGGLRAIAGGVATTGLAGVLFGLLRCRSRSLLAPVLAHWATNAIGLVAAARAGAHDRGRRLHGHRTVVHRAHPGGGTRRRS